MAPPSSPSTPGAGAALPPAVRRTLGLLADPPSSPTLTDGYLDLLRPTLEAVGADDRPTPARNAGAIQAVWASTVGSALYDVAQAAARRLLASWQQPSAWLDLQPGQVVLDVGCGPGSITPALGRAVWPDGLALGVDVSAPMLARAAAASTGAQTAYVRADAQRLPLREATVDAVVSIAALQLVPVPAAALAEMHRVLRPGGRAAVMVPTAGRAVRLWRLLPAFGAHGFDEDELGDTVEGLGFTGVRVSSNGTIQWVRAIRE
ncbi:methyltransferase domain-containing protein [Mycolicibacillus parakoreensis]|uniref:Methyltransferase domain-containing protein n=1 Tax=Mycolicibacillus parakoreensis TaxID=1069221 RepID=A0ABY3U356_9MYCO|nr:methyltransferase domain-containing protein [Mycolicibacillus parakoreensis]MCV7314531.1 methyltransferase domain-containing protein [Mycolicibacillus parakoreensis]ULN53136.1 methyltransferase domain-containing protein [Mycolicibacillus parakoreensis]HLS00131.1 methyltransferase domain-containing protein [Mycolicibacillus parakoreensis]